ncbi:DUF2637 domain-containing protein [Actinocrinis puniceicyclus]|uniref:DUF2637 domain-containing protein n=1 Tax=Actinocrinis puniceicyclus TaxID=977794 RepID=A0A8J7WMB3_9ACTN|nr:DUF2637 domain-containing protein [Actinocrinis puniceicyclus]MBS2962100.1 DUF2637 domain-containing protein [Actinocrinis puniceicyclus]
MTAFRRFTDGVLFQAVLTGSLSFSHIHDLAAVHGQSGWKAWLYPLSVDLLTVAAYRKLTAARSTKAPAGLAWCAFLLGLAASLAANILGAWQNPDRLVAVALGVWPAVAFLVCTLLTHDPTPATAPAPAPARADVPAVVDATAALPVIAAARPVDSIRTSLSRVVEQVEPLAAPAPVAAASSEPVPELPEVSPKFLEWARRVADEHQTVTGTPIDLTTLARKLRVNPPLARAVHTHLLTGSAGA